MVRRADEAAMKETQLQPAGSEVALMPGRGHVRGHGPSQSQWHALLPQIRAQLLKMLPGLLCLRQEREILFERTWEGGDGEGPPAGCAVLSAELRRGRAVQSRGGLWYAMRGKILPFVPSTLNCIVGLSF